MHFILLYFVPLFVSIILSYCLFSLIVRRYKNPKNATKAVQFFFQLEFAAFGIWIVYSALSLGALAWLDGGFQNLRDPDARDSLFGILILSYGALLALSALVCWIIFVLKIDRAIVNLLNLLKLDIHIFLKVLSVCFLFGGILHLLDLFDLRLQFSEMNMRWKIWILYLMIFDFIAALGLWKNTRWGIAVFLLIASSQVVAYGFFQELFTPQPYLISFHLVSVCLYFILRFQTKRRLLMTVGSNI